MSFVHADSMKLIESVQLPDTVEVIGDYAFAGCINLKSITFSKNLRTIGDSAFYATSLEKVELPDSVTYLGSSCFGYIDELIEVSIPKSLKNIDNSMFYGSKNIEKVTIPDGTIINN